MSTTKEDNGNSPAPPALRMRPVLGHDNKWWWDRINEGEMPIQRCKQCGTLRHPPRPMCWKCQSLEWDYIISSGKGTVYSYVVMHRPQFPGYEYPIISIIVDLEEGERMASTLVGCKPEEAKIGMAVEAVIHEDEDGFKIPFFRPA